MKTIDKIFIGLIIVELLVLLPFLFIKNPCGSACDTNSLRHPFGLNVNQQTCIQMCVETFYPLTYLIADILILTTLIYLIVLFTRLLKGGKK